MDCDLKPNSPEYLVGYFPYATDRYDKGAFWFKDPNGTILGKSVVNVTSIVGTHPNYPNFPLEYECKDDKWYITQDFGNDATPGHNPKVVFEVLDEHYKSTFTTFQIETMNF